jgi:hypothetical protein
MFHPFPDCLPCKRKFDDCPIFTENNGKYDVCKFTKVTELTELTEVPIYVDT